jgi:hypothetical protein
MKKNKKLLIVAILASTTGLGLLLSTEKARAISLDLAKIVDTQLNRLVPDNFKQIVRDIRTGGAIGVDSITSVFKNTDETGNIDEDGWKELSSASLGASIQKEVQEAGLGTDTIMGQLKQSALTGINNLNNRKIRSAEAQIIGERAEIQDILTRNAQPADSTLQADNQELEIAAAAASTELKKLDLQSRSLTAQQVANANTLQERQEKLAQKRTDQIGAKSARDENRQLLQTITRPYFGD